MKHKAIISKSDADWSTFKSLRNRVNSTLRNDKEIFYRNLMNKNLDPKDAWKAINSIYIGSRILLDLRKFQNACFNNHFTRVGAKIADSVESESSSFTEYLTDVCAVIVLLISTVLIRKLFLRC